MAATNIEIVWLAIVVGYEFVMDMVEKDMNVGTVDATWDIDIVEDMGKKA